MPQAAPRSARKTPRAQLDREIAEALRRKPKASGSRGGSARAAVKGRAHATKATKGKGNGKQEDLLMVANDAALNEQFERAEEILAQGPQRAIATAFTTVTAESAAAGDHASRGWEDKDGDDIEVDTYDIEEARDKGSHAPVTDAIVKKATAWLRDHGATEASSSHFSPGTWYETEFEMDYGSGEEKQEEFFLRNFTPQEEKLIFTAMNR